MRKLSTLTIALALVLAVASPSLRAWEQVLKEQAIAGVVGVTETRWQLERPRGAARDRIQVHRYRGSGATRAALLYLPGTHMNGFLPGRRGDVIYAEPTEDHNLWLYLAKRGVEVYTLDYRSHFVSSEPANHDFMREWTLDRYVEDAVEALALARTQSKRERVFVAGFSRGVTLAYGVVDMVPPVEVAGLVVLDGAFKRARGGASSFDRARMLEMLDRMHRWAIDVAAPMGWKSRLGLMADVIQDPNRAREDKPDETVGEHLARLLVRSGWTSVGAHSDVRVLAALLIGEDRYFPAMVDLDGRSVAMVADDPMTKVDDAFGSLKLPVIYFGATGFGPEALLAGIYSATRLGSGEVSIHVQEGWGHLDVLVADEAPAQIYEPLLTWLDANNGQ